MRRRIHALVHGRVQGVAFRYCTRKQALRLGLSGWVRNVADGSVELVCEGYGADVGEFVEWLRHGPAMAQVHRLEVDEVELWEQSHEDSLLALDFQIRPTVY